ncbi:hypothetical protein BJ170DRAFT_92961 [Xylariales sp. AK1849]|nr:hypothetical protein BJ170DRAFT_92961 [Xylariales sp. AK1849]
MKRLGYKKSRNGCTYCKQRRVKCDEARPVCGACKKHKLTCNPNGSIVPRHRGSPDAHSQSPRYTSASPLGLVCCSPSYRTNEESPFQSAGHLVSDAELIHHWTISTCQTVSKCVKAQEVLQKDVPREAFRHEFLFHQVLAFTGHHLAYTNPDQCVSYHLQSSQHQDRALRGLRQVLANTVTDTNCHAVFLASTTLVLSSFSSFPAYERFNDSFPLIGSLMDIFTLVGGIKLVVQSGKHHLHQGPFKALSGGTLVKQTSQQISAMGEVLQALRILKERIEETGEQRILDEHGMQNLKSGIVELEAIMEASMVTNGIASTAEYMTVMVWPMMLSNNMIAWLRSELPAALLLLAYYASVLDIAGKDFWFFDGWGKALAKYIVGRLEGTQWAQLLPSSIIVDRSIETI